MPKAELVKSTNLKGVTSTRVIRGKLNEGDKHWGKRSNIKFRKLLEKQKER